MTIQSSAVYQKARWRVKLAAIALVALGSVLLLEVGLRVVLSFQIGQHILWYGVKASRETNAHIHENVVVGRYSKYSPNDIRRDCDVATGEFIDVHINNHGFRGPDFDIEKRPGTFRIVTLGASSTFGYHTPDDQTYPRHLENELTRACPYRSVEVINLGVPHLDSEQIAALFFAEGLPLQPDLVTFYEGANDAQGGAWRTPKVQSLRSRVTTALREHLLVFHTFSRLKQKDAFNETEVTAFIHGKRERFLANLEGILRATSERGIRFVVVTQQARSAGQDLAIANGQTYEAEVAQIRARLAREGNVSIDQVTLLAHDDIMHGLRGWAQERGVSLVDGILALDQHRNTMTSWVHLSGRGNAILARVLAERIALEVCPVPSAANRSAPPQRVASEPTIPSTGVGSQLQRFFGAPSRCR